MTFSRELAERRPMIEQVFADPTAIRAHDGQAWTMLFQAMHPILRIHGLIHGARTSQIDDVTQETWIELQKRYAAEDFDFSDNPLNYALIVNYSKVRNSQRHNARFDKRSNPLPQDHDRSTTSTTESSESSYLDGVVDPRIFDALAQVDPLFVTPFLMATLEDRTHEDIAEELQINKKTVKTRIHRARVKLREILTEDMAA